jgi:hypothetical protein
LRTAPSAEAAIADRRQNRYTDNPGHKERQTETKESAAIASVSIAPIPAVRVTTKLGPGGP